MDNKKIQNVIEGQFGAVMQGELFPCKVLNLDAGTYYYLLFFEDVIHQANYAVILAADYSIEVFVTTDTLNQIIKPQSVRIYESLPGTTVQVVWRPCNLSWSPLYPFWKVQNDKKTIYIDSSGEVYDDLAQDFETGMHRLGLRYNAAECPKLLRLGHHV